MAMVVNTRLYTNTFGFVGRRRAIMAEPGRRMMAVVGIMTMMEVGERRQTREDGSERLELRCGVVAGIARAARGRRNGEKE